MAVRPLTRAQAQQNAAFLAALADTGNVRLAARHCGLNRSMLTKRRAKHPPFAQDWDAALAAAHARFHLGGGIRLPEGKPNTLAAKGGEPTIVRDKRGRLQLRLAQPGALTKAGEQAFLSALAASANVRLAAAATGFSHATLYSHRKRNPGFAREMRLALERGYDRLELAMLAAADPQSYRDDQWRNDPEMDLPLHSLSPAEAIQLLALHRRGVRIAYDAPHARRRRGESNMHYSTRPGLMWAASQRRTSEDRAIARAIEYEGKGEWRLPGEPAAPPPLPPLDQVTGWSKADPANEPHHERVPLFGGWRLRDAEKRRRG
jgi:hypothetical protein